MRTECTSFNDQRACNHWHTLPRRTPSDTSLHTLGLWIVRSTSVPCLHDPSTPPTMGTAPEDQMPCYRCQGLAHTVRMDHRNAHPAIHEPIRLRRRRRPASRITRPPPPPARPPTVPFTDPLQLAFPFASPARRGRLRTERLSRPGPSYPLDQHPGSLRRPHPLGIRLLSPFTSSTDPGTPPPKGTPLGFALHPSLWCYSHSKARIGPLHLGMDLT